LGTAEWSGRRGADWSGRRAWHKAPVSEELLACSIIKEAKHVLEKSLPTYH